MFFAFIQTIFLFSASHAQENLKLIPLSMPRAMESFAVDTRGQVHVSKDLWQEEKPSANTSIYVGLGDALIKSRVDVTRDADNQPGHVIAVRGESQSPGFWEGLGRALGPSSGRPPWETVITDISPDGKIQSETHCYRGTCFNITPRYCAKILNNSGHPDYEGFIAELKACDKTQKAWAKTVDTVNMQAELSETFKANMKRLSNSPLYNQFFKAWAGGLSEYKAVSVDTANKQLLLINHIAGICAKLSAGGALEASDADKKPAPAATR